ncbi:MAG TPA: hypothetical protein VMW29_02215 [Candidatus Bathyarchaeia archaeon]|nr:hypothetical protein [Candidatus Bathyarchaeia archaeon]
MILADANANPITATVSGSLINVIVPLTFTTLEPTASPEQEQTSQGRGILGWVRSVINSILARLFPRN